jgi:hypothetical protein
MSGAVRRLLWRLFPPPEVSATRGYVREFLRRVSPTYHLPAELQRRVLALTRNAEYVVKLIRAERKTPDQVALVMVASTVIGLLTSGRYHIYRGLLNLSRAAQRRGARARLGVHPLHAGAAAARLPDRGADAGSHAAIAR